MGDRMQHRYLLSVTLSSIFVALWIVAGSAPPGQAQAAPGPSPGQIVVSLTNQERAKVGLPPLKENPLLDQAAAAHAQAMADGDFLAHDDPRTKTTPADRVTKTGYHWTVVAENIEAGPERPAEAVSGWMRSPGHRANILSPQAREIGVGYVFEVQDVYPQPTTPYHHYWVQVFGTDSDVYPVIINGEAFSTTNPAVSLYIYGQDWAQQMRFRNDDEPFSAWKPFAGTQLWTLSGGDGLHTVTVELRDGGKVLSASDTIYLLADNLSPTAVPAASQVTPTPTATPSTPAGVPPMPDSVQITKAPSPVKFMTGQETEIRITLEGQDSLICRGIPGRPVDVMMVMDISDSAGFGPGSNWERTVTNTLELLNQLSQPVQRQGISQLEQSQLGIITTQAGRLGPEPFLQQPLTSDYARLREVIKKIEPRGDTNIAAGVRMAASELAKQPAGRAQAILLMLHDNKAIVPDAIQAVEDVRSDVPIYLVANSLNIAKVDQITTKIASDLVDSDHFFPDPDSDQIRDLFISATEGDRDKVGKSIQIVDEWTPTGVLEFFDVVGAGGRVEGNRVVWDVPDIGKGETIPLSYKIRIPAGASVAVNEAGMVTLIDCNGYVGSRNLWAESTAPVTLPTTAPMTPLPPSTGLPPSTASSGPGGTPTTAQIIPTGGAPLVTPLIVTPGIWPTSVPSTITLTLCPGQSLGQNVTVQVPPAPPRADILFIFDVTGSMQDVLASAAQNADQIMIGLAQLIPDVQWAVVSTSDYPMEPYGAAGDHPYLLRQAVTSDQAAVRSALNALVSHMEDGRDAPEAYTRALYEASRDPAIGWRSGARRLIVFFGDSMPHDDDLNVGVPAPQPIRPGEKWTTGYPPSFLDPGSDGTPGTADDLAFQTVLADLRKKDIALLFVYSPSTSLLSRLLEWIASVFGASARPEDLLKYWQYWTAMAGHGSLAVSMENASDVPKVILNVVSQATRRVGVLEVQADPGYQSWVTTQPTQYRDQMVPTAGLNLAFQATFTAPAGMLAGDYRFTLRAIGDGAVYGVWNVSVKIPVTCAPAPAPTPKMTSGVPEDVCAAGLWRFLPFLLPLLALALWFLLQRLVCGPKWLEKKQQRGWKCWLPCLLVLLFSLVIAYLLGDRLARWVCYRVAARPSMVTRGALPSTPSPALGVAPSPIVGLNGSQKVGAIIEGGFFELSSDRPGVTFESVPLANLDRATLDPYDTLVLSQVCSIGSLPPPMLIALTDWVASGRKLIIYDSDECSQPVDYLWLPYPFTTSNPGAQGSSNGQFRIVAEDSMISGDPKSLVFIDASEMSQTEIGDANVMVTRDLRWCGNAEAVNLLGQKGFVHAYAFYGRGLIIYNGLDTDSMGVPAQHKLWQNELAQPWDSVTGKPQGLPCQVRVAGRVDLWPYWLLLPLAFLLWILCWLLCCREVRVRGQRQEYTIPPPGESPSYRQPVDFLQKWQPSPPDWTPAPTLVIGLGGTGRWVLAYLKKNLLDAGAGFWRDQVRLLLIDTAAREMVDGKEQPVEVGGLGLSDQEKLIIGDDLRELIRQMVEDPTAEPEMQPWFPAEEYARVRHLPDAQMDVRQGTNLRRPMGRAVVFHDVHQGETSRVWRTLSQAMMGTVRAQQPRIILVGSLCGGFGSGVLADVAYLARRAAQVAGGEAGTVVITGFLATDNVFASISRTSQLKVNALATLRELGRFLLARGRPFPMQYRRGVQDQVFNGYIEWSLFDEVFVFDGERSVYPLTAWRPEEAMFPLMADLITAFTDQGSRLMEEVRANLRTTASEEQVYTGQPVVSTLGGYTYRLPLVDLVRGLKLQFARDLVLLYLAGPNFRGDRVELSPDLSQDQYRKGIPAEEGIPIQVDHFLRGALTSGGTTTDRAEGVGGPTVFIADLAQAGGVNDEWQSVVNAVRQHPKGEEGYLDEEAHRFREVLSAMLLRLLNGRPEDDVIKARAAKLGYTLTFLGRLNAVLEQAEARVCYLESQVSGPLKPGHRLLTALIAREREVVKACQADLDARVVFLMGKQPAGRPGMREKLGGLLNILDERLEKERQRREAMRQIPVRHTFGDEVFFDKLYKDYFAPGVVAAGLDRLFWYRDDDGSIGLAIRHWEDVKVTTDVDGQEKFIAAMLELAEIIGQGVWQLRLDPFFDSEETGLWNEQNVRSQAENATAWAEPVTSARAGMAKEQEPHRYLWVNRSVQSANQFADKVQLFANMDKPVERIHATDPYSAMVITSLDILPMSALDCVARLETEYRNMHHLNPDAYLEESVKVEWPEPVHVFAAEQRALTYERRLPELREAPRLFHPLFVAALENLDRARAFVLAHALGWIQVRRVQERGEWRTHYVVQIPGEADEIPLTRPDRPQDRVALVVRAMQGFVLGHPREDKPSGQQAGVIQPAPLVIKALADHLPDQVERLRSYLREKPTALADDKRTGADDYWSFARLVVMDELNELSGQRRN
jgi:uncharacterized protein YkwD